MSIKSLFRKSSPKKTLPSTNITDQGQDIESPEYIEEYIKKTEKFIPNVDFSSPENFAKFGSAEKYYTDAINRIINTYPFDGSLKEKIEWHNSSSYLDNYIFENEYPRTNGWANFSYGGWGSQVTQSNDGYGAPPSASMEYIQIKGGPNVGPTGTRSGANIYNTSQNRSTNLYLNGETGVTVEFWLKKGLIVSGSSAREVIFDLWNGEPFSMAPTSQYGRFLVCLDASGSVSPFKITCVSGTVSGCYNLEIGTSLVNSGAIFNDAWNHFAISAKNGTSTNLDVKLYFNGELNDSKTFTTSAFGEVTGSLIANIGALRTRTTGSSIADQGWGKLSGSLDEFRYWKTKRTSREIGRYFRSQVGGGTNTDTANTTLGVYYKFNEGIVGTSSVDATVIDYSGRLSHGTWTGYGTGSRNTGSAIVDSGVESYEFKDPILYSSHPDVIDFTAAKSESGSYHDSTNNASIFNSIPGWIVDEDEEKEANQLKNLTQIISSFFDETHLRIQELSKLKDINYVSGSANPSRFASRLLEGAGFVAPEIFVDASLLSQFGARDEKRLFKKELHNIKNMIYQNIYNNLVYILKSKGTEKSIRNLIRCFGVDDELIKINLYADNATYDFKDNYRSTVARKKYVDFNDPDRFESTVYQFTSSNNPNSVTFISGSGCPLSVGQGLERYTSFTAECEVIFPKKFQQDSELYFETPFTSCSLFGMHDASGSTPYELSWVHSGSELSNFQVYAVRDKIDSKDAYFLLKGMNASTIPTLTSSLYRDVYDNTKWNFAVRVRPTRYPFADIINTATGTFDVEFYGVQTILDDVINEFSVTGSIASGSGCYMMTADKRFYCGAHRTNFTGSVLQKSDAKISSLRFWMDYLPNEVIQAHSRDALNIGTLHPYRHSYLTTTSASLFVPQAETLALNWDFSNVTGSTTSSATTVFDATFVVEDMSSGSVALRSRYGWMGNILKNQHTARGDFFPGSDTQVVDKEYVLSAKQKLPESLDSSNMIDILERDDTTFTRDTRPVNHYFSIEKSMYQTISEEMINIFATIKDFNNLIGEPVHRYRQKYKELQKLKQLFFERVGNTPDFEKYVEFYKWIDSSLSIMIQQLVPASANMSEDIRTMVESHVFERNKYWTKFPTLEMKHDVPEGGLYGINVHLYSWESGSAPAPITQSQHPVWWKERAERDTTQLSSSYAGVNESKGYILSSSFSALQRSWTTPVRLAINTELSASDTLIPYNITNVKSYTTTTASAPWVRSKTWGVQLADVGGWTTSSATLRSASYTRATPNYDQDYQIVQTSGRRINNRELAASASLVNFNQVIPALPAAKTEVSMSAKLRRIRKEHIFVERFSSPGEVNTAGDTDGGPGLDLAAAEYSAYNAAPYRNLAVRNSFNISSSNHAGQFGVDTTLTPVSALPNVSCSFHKTNRNTLTRMKLSSSIAVTSSLYDNFFVQHPIPQSDYNYAWITASALSLTWPIGYASSSSEITFVSASDFGMAVYPQFLGQEPWDVEYQITGSNIRSAGYGYSVNVSGNLYIVGSRGDGGLFSNGGAAYIYRDVGNGVYQQQIKLTSSNLAADDRFGWSVAISGNFSLVSSYWKPYPNAHGYAYLFSNSVGSTWSEIQILTASDGINGDYYGYKVAMNNNIVASSPYKAASVGAVYFYTSSANWWCEHQILTASVGAAGDLFGWDISYRGNTIVASSPGKNAAAGAVYIYTSSANWWCEHQILTASDGIAADSFGYKVAFDKTKNYIIVSAPYKNNSNGNGAVYIYTSSNGWWCEHQKITEYATNMFGAACDISDQTIAVGENNSSFGSPMSGSIYIYASSSAGIWEKLDVKQKEGISSITAFGSSLDMYENTILAGDEYYSVGDLLIYSFIGKAYVFKRTRKPFFAITSLENSAYGTSDFIPDSFNKLNYFIYEPIDIQQNLLGNSLFLSANWELASNGFYGKYAQLFFSEDGFISKYRTPAFTFNSLMNKRNGPYGAPSWKQTRNNEHPVVRYLKNNNFISVMVPTEDTVIIKEGNRETVKALRSGRVEHFTQSAVSSKNYPIIHEVISEDENGKLNYLALKYTLGNDTVFFDNPRLSNILGAVKDTSEIYQNIVSNYTTKQQGAENPIKQFKSLSYKEDIYPRGESSNNRNRELFATDNIWKNNREDRNQSHSNSQGAYVDQSRWSLDGRKNYETSAALSGGLASEGELQNNYVIFWRPNTLAVPYREFYKSGIVYNRRIMEYTYQNNPYQSGLTGSRVPAGDAKWTAADESGKTPYYESHTESTKEIFYSGKDYSLVPEFRISEHMEYYVDRKEGNFLAENNGFLSLTGSRISASNEDNFFKIYSHSDFIKHFDLIKEDHKEVGKLASIKLNCKAKIKFVPYEGFYPVERTLQLATLFSQSYGDFVFEAGYNSSSWAYNTQKWRSFLSPLFAPGVLYNSIKSGIAVDYPIYIGAAPETKTDIFGGAITASAYSERMEVLSSPFTKRIPFEGLVEPEAYLSNNKIWDMEPEESASLRTDLKNSATNQASFWGGKGSQRYKLAMHNFLAEVPDFFLEEGSFTTFNSKPIPKDGITISPNDAKSFFGMDIYVANSEVKTFSDWQQRRNLPQYSSYLTNTKQVSLDQILDIKGIHTQMYSRDSAYGPPWVHDHKIFTTGSNEYSFHYSFEPFTPAYFNGFGLIRLHFFPFKGSGKYTLDEIMSNVTASYVRMPTERTGSSAVYMTDKLLEWQTLATMDKNVFVSGTRYKNDLQYPSVDPYYYAAAIQSASVNWQQLSSSLNFMTKTKVKKNVYEINSDGKFTPTSFEDSPDADDMWVIQPKWETPVFNFKNKELVRPLETQGLLSNPKGMWHQYGDTLDKDEGIWLGINDIPGNTLKYLGSASLSHSSSFGLSTGKKENSIELKSTNASIELLIRDFRGAGALTIGFLHPDSNGFGYSWFGGSAAIRSLMIGEASDGTFIAASADDKISWGGATATDTSNTDFAQRIVNTINTGSVWNYWLSASLFKVDSTKTAWNETNVPFANATLLSSSTGLISGGAYPVGIKFEIINKDLPQSGSSYPNYIAKGTVGNKMQALLVAASLKSGYLSNDDIAVWDAGRDQNGTRKLSNWQNFYGGYDNKFEIKSLADLVGFQKTQKRIGTIAGEKKIKEAVVAVPFMEKNNERKFFTVPRYQIDNILSGKKLTAGQKEPGQSIVDMIKKMGDYVFPPKMDFITNRTVKPFSMYIFEFEQTLTKEDLGDIWQNLMPNIATQYAAQTSTIEHKMLENELLNDSVDGTLRWMVFKVKQKASWNYFAKTADEADDKRFRFNFQIGDRTGGKETIPAYSYNWPNDYFSLVELVKMDAELKWEAKDNPIEIKKEELSTAVAIPGTTDTSRLAKKR